MLSDVIAVARTAYYGYKVVQAARLFAGDVTVLGELLVEGLGELAAEQVLEAATEYAVEAAAENVAETVAENVAEAAAENVAETVAEHVVATVEHVAEIAAENQDAITDTRESAKDLRESMSDFDQYVKKLQNDPSKSSPDAAAKIAEARMLHEKFVMNDKDGSGTLSRDAFANFYADIGAPLDDAGMAFDLVDKDKNGKISFLAWINIAPLGFGAEDGPKS